MGQCPDSIKRLMYRFTQQADQLRSPDCHRVDFITRGQIQREMYPRDRQIGQLVYQIYGPTEGEIQSVEEATE